MAPIIFSLPFSYVDVRFYILSLLKKWHVRIKLYEKNRLKRRNIRPDYFLALAVRDVTSLSRLAPTFSTTYTVTTITTPTTAWTVTAPVTQQATVRGNVLSAGIPQNTAKNTANAGVALN